MLAYSFYLGLFLPVNMTSYVMSRITLWAPTQLILFRALNPPHSCLWARQDCRGAKQPSSHFLDVGYLERNIYACNQKYRKIKFDVKFCLHNQKKGPFANDNRWWIHSREVYKNRETMAVAKGKAKVWCNSIGKEQHWMKGRKKTNVKKRSEKAGLNEFLITFGRRDKEKSFLEKLFCHKLSCFGYLVKNQIFFHSSKP